MEAPQVIRELKHDVLGRVELVRDARGLVVRRVAVGAFGTGFIARRLLARERRALHALAPLAGVARLVEERPRCDVLERSFMPGVPLCLAEELPRDFFERLEELVRALHARGVCHNDLHKEGNVLVGEDGRPALVDFQLASVHPRGGRRFAARAREDLRHVWKHRSFYLAALGESDPLAGRVPRRGLVAGLWRCFGKPVYRALTRPAWLRARLSSGEPRRGKDGPWPRWSAPVGPRA